MMLAGAGTAILLLGLIAWAMLRYSRDRPIAKFFTYSAWLMAVLTVVLAGKGVAALQEAGIKQGRQPDCASRERRRGLRTPLGKD